MRLVHVALLAAITGLACGPKPEPASAVHTPPDLPPQSVPSPPPLRFAVTFPPALSSAPLDGRLLVILGITSMSVYGIALAGWSSNNKYSLLGALRSSAQMISYELALGLSLVGVVLRAGSLNLRVIVEQQATLGAATWNILGGGQFIAFFIYLMAAFAETNRLPFDLPEAETELIAGYHTEYSAMRFGLYFLGEYINMVTVCSIATALFLGGWLPLLPFHPFDWIPGPIWFLGKVFVLLFVMIWVRWTLPRLRYDRLMNFGWKVLLPLGLINIVVTGAIVALRA